MFFSLTSHFYATLLYRETRSVGKNIKFQTVCTLNAFNGFWRIFVQSNPHFDLISGSFGSTDGGPNINRKMFDEKLMVSMETGL